MLTEFNPLNDGRIWEYLCGYRGYLSIRVTCGKNVVFVHIFLQSLCHRLLLVARDKLIFV